MRENALTVRDTGFREEPETPTKEGTFQVQTTGTARVTVEAGGTGVVGHVGLHALGAFADALGLGSSISEAIPTGSERAAVHDRGKVLTHAALMLAGGGEACSDIEHLRAQQEIFGQVCSDSTLYRTLRYEVSPKEVQAALSWVHWFNTERLHGYCGDVPPAELEAAFYAAQPADQSSVGIKQPEPPLHAGGFTALRRHRLARGTSEIAVCPPDGRPRVPRRHFPGSPGQPRALGDRPRSR